MCACDCLLEITLTRSYVLILMKFGTVAAKEFFGCSKSDILVLSFAQKSYHHDAGLIRLQYFTQPL